MNFHDCDVYDFVRARVDELGISIMIFTGIRKRIVIHYSAAFLIFGGKRSQPDKCQLRGVEHLQTPLLFFFYKLAK